MKLDFWFDPACPWTWITSRWMSEVAAERDVEVTWRPFSLGVKNGLLDGSDPDVPAEIVEGVRASHRSLRVIAAVQAAALKDGDEAAVGPLYTELGRRIHHDDESIDDLGAVLEAAGLDATFAEAADDESWDDVITTSMDEGLGLVGDDVGVPILGFPSDDGQVGFFGPIFSPAPTGADALKVFDAVHAAVSVPGFFELKRTRDVGPLMPARP